MSNDFGNMNCPKLVLYVVFSNLESFSSLGSCVRVCKRWRDTIEQNDKLWKQIMVKESLEENFLDGANELFKCDWKKLCKVISCAKSFDYPRKGESYNLKSIVVGASRVGKTSLINVRESASCSLCSEKLNF